jgi:hypothetical protein
MITNTDAVARSLQRYCTNGEYCIAAGDGKNFTNFFYKETVQYFDVTNDNYWLVDPSLKPQPAPNTTDEYAKDSPTTSISSASDNVDQPGATETSSIKKFKSITISGKVPLERYTELFGYFITPFALNSNKIEIEVKFKIKSTEASQLDETKQQYKSAKEASKQLGLDFEEDAI